MRGVRGGTEKQTAQDVGTETTLERTNFETNGCSNREATPRLRVATITRTVALAESKRERSSPNCLERVQPEIRLFRERLIINVMFRPSFTWRLKPYTLICIFYYIPAPSNSGAWRTCGHEADTSIQILLCLHSSAFFPKCARVAKTTTGPESRINGFNITETFMCCESRQSIPGHIDCSPRAQPRPTTAMKPFCALTVCSDFVMLLSGPKNSPICRK